MTEDSHTTDLVSLTADLVTAYVANNAVNVEALPGLIGSIHGALAGLGQAEEAAETHVPAVSTRKSLANPEHIVSLIDGKPYKSLKRHLSAHGLTPEDYRARYDLPASYPMVSRAYSEKRRAVAKALGLGRKPRASEPAPAKKPARKPRAARTKAPA